MSTHESQEQCVHSVQKAESFLGLVSRHFKVIDKEDYAGPTCALRPTVPSESAFGTSHHAKCMPSIKAKPKM